jgi:hypothetical protein
MNQLELRLSTHDPDSDGNSYLIVEILVDRSAIVNFGGLATDLNEFERSLKLTGSFYIITCWCGDPGCAGISEAVHVQHEGTVVRWRLVSPKPARTFVFAQENYQAVLANVISQGKRLIDSLRSSSSKTLVVTPNWNVRFFCREAPTSSEQCQGEPSAAPADGDIS